MTASFNALRTSKEKLVILIALFSLVTWIFPAAGKAHAEAVGQTKSLVFEINPDSINALLNPRNKNPNFENIDKEVTLVRQYLQSKNSPLANYTEILLAQPDWKTIIAISNAESTMGKHCYYNNCSGIYERFGIGYAGLKKYDTMADWIVDLQQLINQRYDGWTLAEMNGTYVYPKSRSWLYATTTVYNDLDKIQAQFPAES